MAHFDAKLLQRMVNLFFLQIMVFLFFLHFFGEIVHHLRNAQQLFSDKLPAFVDLPFELAVCLISNHLFFNRVDDFAGLDAIPLPLAQQLMGFATMVFSSASPIICFMYA